MNRKLIAAVSGVTALLAMQSEGFAQLSDTDTQVFRITAPANVQIRALGADPVLGTYDPTNPAFDPFADYNFPAQPWTVRGNVLTGVSVDFSTLSAFTHTTDPTWKRDARLAIQITGSNGPANWNVTQATDTTNYGGGDEVATCLADSDGVGRASFDVSVSVITVEYGTFAAGDYELTVRGTVTENP